LARIWVILLIIALFFVVRWFRKTPPDIVARHIRMTVVILLAIILIILAATGRLNWIFAVAGILFAFLMRMLPVIVRLAPELHKLWFLFKGPKQKTSHQTDSKPGSNTMSIEEAYEILGLSCGATKQQVILAHRKLIQKIHPDRGGNTYLASKINLAKQVLIKKLGT
jgi:hypothetical protein